MEKNVTKSMFLFFRAKLNYKNKRVKNMKEDEGIKFFQGLINGILLSIPIWAVIIYWGIKVFS